LKSAADYNRAHQGCEPIRRLATDTRNARRPNRRRNRHSRNCEPNERSRHNREPVDTVEANRVVQIEAVVGYLSDQPTGITEPQQVMLGEGEDKDEDKDEE
jgi:hypothetical protein